MRETSKEILEFCNDYVKATGGTIASLCRKANIKPEILSMWKVRGDQIPKINTLIALSEAMDITVSELIGQKEPSKPVYPKSVLDFAGLVPLLTEVEVKSVLAVARTFYEAHLGEKREIV